MRNSRSSPSFSLCSSLALLSRGLLSRDAHAFVVQQRINGLACHQVRRHGVSLPPRHFKNVPSPLGLEGPTVLVANETETSSRIEDVIGSKFNVLTEDDSASKLFPELRNKQEHKPSWLDTNMGKSNSVAPASKSTRSNSNHGRIIFGTAAICKADNPLELLDAAYEKGFRRFDLARTYGGGASELIFGEWMEDRGIDRASVDIITKGGMGQDKYGDPNRPILTRSGLQAEVKASLDALRTAWVDLYLFHRDDPRIHVAQFVVWANELVLSGKIKKWGVSNWSFRRFRQAFDFAVDNGLEPPLANSPQFSLAVPKCEVWPTTQSISGPQSEKQIEWYEDNNIELLCWEVLAKGFMAKPHMWSEDTVDPSTFDSPVEIGSDEWRLQRLQKAYCYDLNYRRRSVAMQLAKELGYKLSQVATLYPLSMGENISVIFGSTNLDHLDDMIGLHDCQLDEEAKFRLSACQHDQLLSRRAE